MGLVVEFPVIGSAALVVYAEELSVGLPVGTLVVAFSVIAIVMDAEGLAVRHPVGALVMSFDGREVFLLSMR
jgi:hypothetical protein